MQDIGAWLPSRLLMGQYGPLALDRACDRIHEFAAVGDMRGCALWSRVAAAINELARVERRAGQSVK